MESLYFALGVGVTLLVVGYLVYLGLRTFWNSF